MRARRIDDVSRCLGEFALALHRDIPIEEATLIALLEAQTEMKLAGPTRLMRKGRIEAMHDRLSRLVATRRCAVIL